MRARARPEKLCRSVRLHPFLGRGGKDYYVVTDGRVWCAARDGTDRNGETPGPTRAAGALRLDRGHDRGAVRRLPPSERPTLMNKTLLPIRIVFVLLFAAAGWLVCYASPDWD